MATNNNNTRVQIPSKFSLLGRDGLISQPWAYYLQSITSNLAPVGSGYIIDGSAGTTGPTTIYQGADATKSGSPGANDIFVADDTGEVYTVSGGQWQRQTPAFTGDVIKDAFSNTTTLASVNATPGVYGDTNTIPIITVNEKGLVTDIQLVSVTAAPLVLPGKVGDFIFTANTLGEAGANNLYNVNTFTVSYKLGFHQADATPEYICTIPANTLVTKIELVIMTAFDGTNPTVSVGSGPGYNELMDTTDNNPTIISNWSVDPGVRYTSEEDVYVAIAANGGSAGYAMVNISTVQL